MTQRPRNQVTIYDVAKTAGVAPSTVSRTFARPGRVNAETAAWIRQVADELGYRANPIVQSLLSSKTRMLGVMVSDMANPYYPMLVRGVQLAATEAGYDLLLTDCRESGTRERAALERLVPLVEGFIIGSSRMSDSALRTIAKQRPTIVLNRSLNDVPSLVPDNAGGMAAAVKLLHELGHVSVVYVAGPEASWTDGVRFHALRDHAAAVGMTVQKTGHHLPVFEGGLQAAASLADRAPTAVVAYNDLLAIGVMHGFIRHGLLVPEQVSVIGFDDILTSRLATPPLTTVAGSIRQMGATAVGNVIAIINGAKPKGGDALTMPVQLVVRGSTGPRRKKRVPASATAVASAASVVRPVAPA